MSSKQEDDRNMRKPGEAPTGTNNNPACDQCRTRKIRCDREAPSCSNCRKAHLPCDFTNKGKRINHTKQLVEDFSFLSGRLESIDASIAKITQRLELESLPPGSSPGSSSEAGGPTDDLNHFTRPIESPGYDEVSEATVTKSSSSVRHNFYISRDQDGGETYHGPTAGRALFQQTRFFVEDLLDSIKPEEEDEQSEEFQQLKALIGDNPTVRTELRKCSDAFPFHPITQGLQPTHDGRIVSRPPQSIVESSLDFFLEEMNTVLPLFDPDHLRSAVKEQYANSTRNSASSAWDLLFNNIVVLVMGIKLKTALCMNVRQRSMNNEQNDMQQNNPLMGAWQGNAQPSAAQERFDDIFLQFLANSHRAFGSLSEYLAPRLVNVQALITLALVAADHFQHGVFESLVHRACALGREMGLERYLDTTRPGQSAAIVERRRVFWSLYVLDKRRTFLTGKPCELYLAESDLETPKLVQKEMWAKNALARIHMMSIWEEIWKNLYSSRAMRNSAKFREEQINRLRRYLKAWVTHHKPILERPESVELGNATCMRLELRYSFHVAQILVHRCLDKSDNLQQQINNARAALKIIRDISQGPATVSGISLLARLFRTYPILPFYEIHKRTMLEVDEESKEDMELLQSCIDAISIFQSTIPPAIYYNRLRAGLSWCMNIATILRKMQDRPQTAPPMSRTTSAKGVSSPLSRQVTGKRDSESVNNDDDATPIDPRSQRRRMVTGDTTMSSNVLNSGTNTTDTSQSGSVGPDTPSPGYFSDFHTIDPFGTVDAKLAPYPSMPSVSASDISDLGMPTGSMGVPTMTPTNMHDNNKDSFNLNGFAFNYPTPLGTINPTRTATCPPTRTGSPSMRNGSLDLSSLVARLPPDSQHALTAVPPSMSASTSFGPATFSTFNMDLSDDSFTNVGHHPDIVAISHPGHHVGGFGQGHYFDFAPDQIGFGPMDGIMNVDGI